MAKIKHIKTPEEIAYLAAFGKELNNLLKRLKLSQIEFGRILNVHKNSVNKWVKGINYPQPLLLKKIIEFFLTNPKIKDFNPYTLLLAGSYNKYKSSKYDLLINELKINFEKEIEIKLSKNDEIWNKKYTILENRHKNTVENNISLSKANDEYNNRYDAKKDYLKLKKELENERLNFLNQEREKYALRLVKKLGMVPSETAKQILKETELKNFINTLRLVNDDDSINENYEEFYKNLIEVISNTISLKITNFIKLIYNPNIAENKTEE